MNLRVTNHSIFDLLWGLRLLVADPHEGEDHMRVTLPAQARLVVAVELADGTLVPFEEFAADSGSTVVPFSTASAFRKTIPKAVSVNIVLPSIEAVLDSLARRHQLGHHTVAWDDEPNHKCGFIDVFTAEYVCWDTLNARLTEDTRYLAEDPEARQELFGSAPEAPPDPSPVWMACEDTASALLKAEAECSKPKKRVRKRTQAGSMT